MRCPLYREKDGDQASPNGLVLANPNIIQHSVS